MIDGCPVDSEKSTEPEDAGEPGSPPRDGWRSVGRLILDVMSLNTIVAESSLLPYSQKEHIMKLESAVTTLFVALLATTVSAQESTRKEFEEHFTRKPLAWLHKPCRGSRFVPLLFSS